PDVGSAGRGRTRGSAESALVDSVSVSGRPGPASSPSTRNPLPKSRAASAIDAGVPPRLTTTRTPASMFFGTVGFAGSTVAVIPAIDSFISPIWRSGAWANAGRANAGHRRRLERARRPRRADRNWREESRLKKTTPGPKRGEVRWPGWY